MSERDKEYTVCWLIEGRWRPAERPFFDVSRRQLMKQLRTEVSYKEGAVKVRLGYHGDFR